VLPDPHSGLAPDGLLPVTVCWPVGWLRNARTGCASSWNCPHPLPTARRKRREPDV